MLKISKPLGVQKTTEYYKFEHTAAEQAYYSERETICGEWHGKLALEFGLIGPVKEEHYNRLADGRDPWSNEVLIKHRGALAIRERAASLGDQKLWRARLESLLLDASRDNREVFRKHADGAKMERRAKSANSIGAENETNPRTKALLDMHAIAREVYAANLMNERGGGARSYLKERGIKPETAKEFGLGLALEDGNQLADKLRHYGPELMRASGLFVEYGGEFYDRFRDRLMFPIENAAGHTIAFAGRNPPSENGPKYMNSPATELYSKGEQFYNLHRASHHIGETGQVVVVEGYLDAIAAHQAGQRNVVAIAGTVLSAAQISTLADHANVAILHLDGDDAGKRAAERHIPPLLDAGMTVRALNLRDDPAAWIQENGGKEYRNAVGDVPPLVSYLADRAREKYDLSDLYEKVDAQCWMLSMLDHVQPHHRAQIAMEVEAYLQIPNSEASGAEQRGAASEAKPKAKYSEHIAAWDWTLAPHKSYSVTALVGGDRGLIEDHNEAVRIALDAGEEYTQARLRDVAAVTSGNWCAALFLHDSARPVGDAPPNPHLHTHAVVFNMTNAGDKIRSVQSREWYRIQSYVSAVYQSEMAFRARKRGYELEHGRNYSTAIKGYSEEYLNACSARTQEIEAEKTRLGLTGAGADERINKRLRQAKQAWEPEALHAEHRAQAERYDQHPEEVVASAKLRHSQLLPEAQRLKLAQEAVSFAKKRLLESNAVVDHYELMRDALRFGLGHLHLPDVEHAMRVRLLQEEREFHRIGHYRPNAPGERFTSSEMRDMELETIALALKRKGAAEPIAGGLTRDRFREQYKDRVVEGKKIRLNDQQLWMAWNVLTCRDQVMLVRGAAGVGKSTAMQPIAQIAQRAGYEVVGLAPTGAAANKLAEIGIRAETLQAHLLRRGGTAPKRLYIVDEGSLVGTRQLHSFLAGVRPEDRVIVAHDPRQHQSVEAGRIVEELEQAGVSTFRLEKIVRQQNAPELLEVIERFAAGSMVAGLRLLEDQKRIREFPSRKHRFAAIAREYAASPGNTVIDSPDNRSLSEINAAVRSELQAAGVLKVDRYEARVLVGRRDVRTEDRKRAATYNVEDIVRFGRAVGFLGVSSGEYARVVSRDVEANEITLRLASGRDVTYDPSRAFGVEIFTAEKRWFAEGERVQLTRPWKNGWNKVANREVGTIQKIDGAGNALVKLDTGQTVKWKLDAMPHLEYAYAMTGYSLQSKTSERTLLQIDTGDSRIRTLLDKPLLYVGSSRAARELLIFTDDKECLLGENSPVNRMALKPKALAREEIERHAIRMTA